MGNLFGSSSAPQWKLLSRPLDSPGLAAAGMDAGVDEGGPHRIDADAFTGDFVCKPDGQRVDRSLRSRVIDILSGGSEPRCRGRHVDDQSSLAAVAGGHPFDRFTTAE